MVNTLLQAPRADGRTYGCDGRLKFRPAANTAYTNGTLKRVENTIAPSEAITATCAFSRVALAAATRVHITANHRFP